MGTARRVMDGDAVLIRVPSELSEEQREGCACVWCGSEDSPAMVALGMVGGDWLFMCSPGCWSTPAAGAGDHDREGHRSPVVQRAAGAVRGRRAGRLSRV
jgi:hypothetical protein